MFDVFGLPPKEQANVKVYYPQGTNTNGTWQQWMKPRGTSVVYMFAIGGGGGGGGGFTRASGAAGGGGGGGGAATASLLIPAFFVPDVLYVQPGVGGLGGAANTAGSAGGHSYVSIGAYQQVHLHQ